MQDLDFMNHSAHSSGGISSCGTSSSSCSDFFSQEPPVCQSLVCVICHDVFKKPSSLRCGHTFCNACIREFFSQRERSCPICRRQYTMSFSLTPNLVAQQVITELEDFYRKSKEEKHEMETIRRFLLSSNQTLQTNLDMHETSLEESKRLFNTLEIQSSQELSKVEAELQKSLDEKRELEESNQVLRATVQQLQAAQEESQSNYEVLEFTLREEIQTRYNQMAHFRQEQDRLNQQMKLMGAEMPTLRNSATNGACNEAPTSRAISLGNAKIVGCSPFSEEKSKSQSLFSLESEVLSTTSPPLDRIWRRIWTSLLTVFHVLSDFPVLLGGLVGNERSTPLQAHYQTPATKAIQKLLNVFYAVWLLWIFYSIVTAATFIKPEAQ